MPLSFCSFNQEFEILKVNNKRLKELGFVKGEKIMKINSYSNIVIVKIKDINYALDKAMLNSIIVK